MSETTQYTPTRQPERSRAVFSQEDFELIRVAISRYLHEAEEHMDLVKYSNLYHRLGRLTK